MLTDLRCSEVAPEARRNTLVIPFTALNTSVWSPESQPKSLRGHELLETLQTGTWWGLQRAQLLPSTWFQREFRAPEKSSRTPRHIFSHLKYSRPTPYRGRFSAEVEQVGIPPVSTKPCAWLPCSWTWGHPRCLREQMEREKGAYLWLLEGKSETVKTLQKAKGEELPRTEIFFLYTVFLHRKKICTQIFCWALGRLLGFF